MHKEGFDSKQYPDLMLLEKLKRSRVLARKRKDADEPNMRLTNKTPPKRLLSIEREEFHGYQFETHDVTPHNA
eukprot:12665396-Ditylum_brightwellii.AAC.1